MHKQAREHQRGQQREGNNLPKTKSDRELVRRLKEQFKSLQDGESITLQYPITPVTLASVLCSLHIILEENDVTMEVALGPDEIEITMNRRSGKSSSNGEKRRERAQRIAELLVVRVRQ